VENQDFMGKTNYFLSTLPFSPWGSFSHMVACRSSSKNIGKISLIPIFNKNLSQAHTESKLDVFGVYRKLVKYVVHLSKRTKLKNIFFFTQAAQTAIDQFLVSRNFRG
jgi:hypothetical protein